LPDTLKQAVGTTSDTGVIIISIEGGGPAEQAGLFIGDILVTLDGTPVTDTDAVQGLLGPERIGSALQAKVARGGQPVDVTITVGERPQREGQDGRYRGRTDTNSFPSHRCLRGDG
jgi:S1-C subfamily serine protease